MSEEIRSNKDSDSVPREDFINAFRLRGLTMAEILDAFNMADIQKDGVLSLDEWRAFFQYFVKP